MSGRRHYAWRYGDDPRWQEFFGFLETRARPTLTEMGQTAGNFAEAANIHRRLFPFIKTLFLDGNPVGIKYAMKLTGLDTGELRLPLWEASDATRKLIEEQVRRLNIPIRAA